LFFSQIEKKQENITPPCSSTFSQLPGLVYAVAGRARALRKKPTEGPKKCSMQDDYVAHIANMLVALYQRRSFMVCDPGKRLGACHDAALDDRDRLESVIMRANTVKTEFFQALRVEAVIMRAGQLCICCTIISFSNFFFLFSMHYDSTCVHTGCIGVNPRGLVSDME
jgi:hypothetical protein